MANIGSEANIGNNAEIGASAGIGDDAKIGSKAYGEQEDPWPPVPPTPQGVVLYDGAITLDEDGQGSIELAAAMVLGYKAILTLGDDECVSYITIEIDDTYASFYFDAGYGNTVYVYNDGSVIATDENGDPITGEFTIKLEQEPVELTTLFDGAVALTLQTGEIQFMEGTANLTGGAVAEGDWAFVYEDGALKAVGVRGNSAFTWPDGTYTSQVDFTADDEATYQTDDLTVSSVNLKVAVPAT